MNNPWEDIKLDDYEKHMSLDSVKQLQTMNSIMKEQFEAYPVETAMVLGVAGGNGLEHVRVEKFKKVFGVDINRGYLDAVSERYKSLSEVLECRQADLINDYEKLPKAQLVIANLLIEYVGYQVFQKVILQVNPQYASCVIQINTDDITLPKFRIYKRDDNTDFCIIKDDKNENSYIYCELNNEDNKYKSYRIYSEGNLIQPNSAIEEKGIANKLLKPERLLRKVDHFNGYIGFIKDRTMFSDAGFEREQLNIVNRK